jgi:hypothetical protein
MPVVDKRKVLRVNCPGYGTESFFSAGCADALDNYEVIIVNPISILHLFDKDPELLTQIAAAQSEGMTSHVAKSDKLLQSVVPDVELRTQQLASFLARGGLLVYFLTPPFLVQGPSLTLDNYYWLDVLAPENSGDKNKRNMSSASRGKVIQPTPEGESSPFAAYFRQPGLEWTTLVRAENLAAGYTILATAGPNKCIAAELVAGDSGGRVIFLPAPYETEFDNRLMECVHIWMSSKTGEPAPVSSAPSYDGPPMTTGEMSMPDISSAAPTAKSALDEAPSSPPDMEVFGKDEYKPEPVKEERPNTGEFGIDQPAPQVVAEEKQEEPKKEEPKPERKKEPESKSKPEPKPEPERKPEPVREPEPAAPVMQESGTPPAKELMEKMEEISKTPPPEWCVEYSFSDLDNLREELLELNEQVRLTQVKITEVESRITNMEWLKNALLSADGRELHDACSRVFEHLGWTCNPSATNTDELLLRDGEWTAGIAKIVRTTSQVKRSDLAQLAESIITYWGEHETEPKGILVASTWANRPPTERNEPDYTDALADFAQKKSLCLMTTMQLLCIYRDLESGRISSSDLKESILATSGRLPGFVLEQDYAIA